MDDNFLALLIKHHSKPLIKEALKEFLAENELVITPSRTSSQGALISTADARKYFGGIDRHTLYRYVHEGLPAFKSGKSYKFRKDDIEHFISQKSVKPRLRKSA
jgi:excisionase family DNA binding protein